MRCSTFLIATVLSALLIAGCSRLQLTTNAGPFITDSISSTLVREYSISEISQYDATTLGFVDASYCQTKLTDRKATKSVVVRDLKLRTKNMGGNGLVVEACGVAESGACHSYLECRGVAYRVPERKGESATPAGYQHF